MSLLTEESQKGSGFHSSVGNEIVPFQEGGCDIKEQNITFIPPGKYQLNFQQCAKN